ncbi:MAG: PQQ-binding-like beta-propeller repeat protein [Planctomycetaceae bacterium]|nr:PQQ-binding-like beta-propeller repeat protein [Planctomycetaceae bacterium]
MRMLATFLWIGLCTATLAADAPWNQFRGPRGDGTSTETGLPVKFGEGSKEIVWKTPIPGRAWSSPVVWGKQIWLTNAPDIQGNTKEKVKLDKPIELSAVCVDLETGKIIHNRKLFEVSELQITHPTNTFASPTPFIEEDRVYIHFGSYGTACLDTKSGETIWERHDLECDHFRGPGSSPVVHGDLLYLTFDGYDLQYIAALNKKTGKTVWKQDRGIDYKTKDGDAKKGYSTPSIIEVGGRELLISPFAYATIAYEPKTGEPIWTVFHGGMNAAARPLYGNGLLYINAADGGDALVAVKPEGKGDITKNIVWRTSEKIPKRSSQLLVGDLYFMMNDSGIATCLDAKSGKMIWTQRLRGEYWSSPLLAGGLIYCFSKDGDMQVFKASREFELVAENKLDDGSSASPIVAGKSLIVRTKSHLYRIEKRD